MNTVTSAHQAGGKRWLTLMNGVRSCRHNKLPLGVLEWSVHWTAYVVFSHLFPFPQHKVCVCEHLCANPTVANTRRRWWKPCQVISHSHTRAVMSAPLELTHYLSEPTKDAPSGGAGIKQVEVQAGRWGGSVKRGGEKQWGAQTETVHPSPEGASWGEKIHSDRPEYRHMEAEPHRQLPSPCSDDSWTANPGGADGARGSPSAARRDRNEGQSPASCLSLCPPPNLLWHHWHPYNLAATRELSQGEGGPDLPGCIWLTGDWEGALRAHVTIDNPRWEGWSGGPHLLSVFIFIENKELEGGRRPGRWLVT